MTDANHPQKPNSADALPNPFLNPTKDMHAVALAEIRSRGEDPKEILQGFDLIEQRLREQCSQPEPAKRDTALAEHGDWIEFIGNARYFDESVAAGVPTPGQLDESRPFEFSDLFQGIDPRGKLFFKISGHSMTGSSIKHHDLAMVDPKVEIRDGDLILANVAGLGQVVKRLRIVDGVAAALDSENPEFKPIPINDPADLRIHGKVVWSGGIRR